jgi:hypothetical protein
MARSWQKLLRILPGIFSMLLLSACQNPPTDAQFSPDGRRWIRVEELPPDPAKEQLLPTQRLVLGGAWARSPLVLVEDMENFCGLATRWIDASRFYLELPLAAAPNLRVQDGQVWAGVTLEVRGQQRDLLFDRYSNDYLRRLVVIANCERTLWNLYLRNAGDPLYDAAMEEGWNDPRLFGGFSAKQPAFELTWTGPRRARIRVAGRLQGITLRESIEDVRVDWVFTNKDAPKTPEPEGQSLKLIDFTPAGEPQ